MRRIFEIAGILVPILALLAWTAPRSIAAEHGHVEFAHAAGVGSVHFAPHEVAHPSPVVREADHAVRDVDHAVRDVEHVGAEVAHAAYRNPYRDDYFRRFPPGYHPYVINGAQYYGYYSPPAGCTQSVLNGITYFLFGGIYYRPYMYGGQTIYLVVPAPV